MGMRKNIVSSAIQETRSCQKAPHVLTAKKVLKYHEQSVTSSRGNKPLFFQPSLTNLNCSNDASVFQTG